MSNITNILIIYNPNSTGSSKEDARELRKKLKSYFPKLDIKTHATKYAGHAEKLARQQAIKHKNPLIISSSGDGGYHEVVNGIMSAKSKGKTAICAVLPAGNANDHSRTMHDEPLEELIRQKSITALDLLEVTVSHGGKTTTRYAHSYAGLGLTPAVAVELNKHTLNAIRELRLVLRTFLKYRPFKIRTDSKTYTLDSILFANINKMAKVLTLAEENKPRDGLFEIITFPHKRKFLLVATLLKAATVGLKTTHQESEYNFEVLKDMPMQLDGEITKLLAGSVVKVRSAQRVLKTVVSDTTGN